MSSNFLDVSGFFAGVDIHIFYTVGPPPALPPVPVPNVHAVFQLHLGIQHRFWHVVTSVTTGYCPVLQNGWAMHIVPHIPIPLPPHPVAEGVNLATIWATSSSQPQLSAHSVTGKGTPLLVEILWFLGANADCGIGIVPNNVDMNFNSVVTVPSAGDYAAMVAGFVMNGLLNTAIAFIPWNPVSIAIALGQYVGDAFGVDPISNKISDIQKAIQKAVDG